MQKTAFTLLELLIVITIVAILAGAVVPLFKSSREEAMILKARQDLEALAVAGRKAYCDMGGMVLPPDELDAVYPEWPEWKGPWIEKVTPDPWGTNYTFTSKGALINDQIHTCHFYFSYGPNKVSNNALGDDINITLFCLVNP